MSGSDDGDDDDKVGYRRPPKKHRFKPGQSGNPSGRRYKVPSTFDDIVAEIANELVQVKEGDGYRKEIMGKVILRQLFRDAASGKSKDRKIVLEMLKKVKGLGERDMTHDELVGTLTHDELQSIEGIRNELAKYLPKEDSDEED